MVHTGCPKCQRRLHYPDSEESVILRCPACQLVFRVTPGWELPEEFIDRGLGPAPLYIFSSAGVVSVLLLVVLTHMLVIMRREIAARKSRPPQPVAAKPVPKVPAHLLNVKGAWDPVETPTTVPDKPAPVQSVDTSRIPETIVLHAKDAKTHGQKITYEVGGPKDNIGNWVEEDAWVQWDLEFAAPGTYEVEIYFGCEPRSSGSTYRVIVGDQEVTGTITSTGHWDTYDRRSLGEIHIDRPGKASLEVRPVAKPGQAVMNLRSITLRPPGGAAPPDPPPHVKVPTIKWRNRDPALPFNPEEPLLLDAGNAISIGKGWIKEGVGDLVTATEARTAAVRWKLKFARATTVRVEITYQPASEGQGMAFRVIANGKAFRGQTDPPDGQTSRRRTDVLGTFAMPKGVVRIDLGGNKEPIASPQKFYGLRLTPVGE